MTRLCFVFVLIAHIGLGQELQHGVGLIYPSKSSHQQMGTYFPTNGLRVYSRRTSSQIGDLLLEKEANHSNSVSFQGSANKTSFDLDYTSITQVSYSNTVVVFFERSDGFLRIINKEKDYWLRENEVLEKGFRILDWSQFLIEKSNQMIGYFPKSPGLNLRESPSKEGKLIKTLVGDSFQIRLTNNTNGLWVKVKVMKLKDQPSPCGDGAIEYEMQGWIKLLDDSGIPNVSFYFDC